MSEQRQVYSVSELRDVTERIFQHWKVPVEQSAIIADTLPAGVGRWLLATGCVSPA